MTIFLLEEFQMLAIISIIRTTLISKGWLKKTARQGAKEHNADLSS